ncbi:MAG: OmpA family protein [Muribaculaceae bacterium]|nr:OmpA family protein [Muribaculaceae bacterium]
MKKLLLIAAIALSSVAAQAQGTVLERSKFFDNWSVGLKGGAVSPMNPNAGFFEMSRGIVGAEIRKEITPVFGLGIEGEWTVNTSSWSPYHSSYAFDHQYVGVFGTINLMNAFGGYKGTPRVFEIELLAGTGWLHAYFTEKYHDHLWLPAEDGNSWANKVGLNFNFNLGKSRAWTLALKPAVLWNMGRSVEPGCLGVSSQYNKNAAFVEMEAGITYHFKNSNGTHSFKILEPMDHALINSLNEQINDLRGQVNECNATGAALKGQLSDLEAQLEGCPATPCVEVVPGLNNNYYVFYKFDSATIEPMQRAQIDLVASALKANSEAKVVIKGYASKDGDETYNEKLAQKRADAVKKELVKRYGIDADRIDAKGAGVSKLFNKLGWNRCAACEVVVP